MVVREGERCLVFPSLTHKNLVGDGFTEKGNTVASILGDVSVWCRSPPR